MEMRQIVFAGLLFLIANSLFAMDPKTQRCFDKLVQLAQDIEKSKDDYDEHIKAIEAFSHGYLSLNSADRKFVLIFENGVIDYNNKETVKTESEKKLLELTKKVLINYVLTPLVRNKRAFYRSESDVFTFMNCFTYVCSLDSGRLSQPLFYINCSRNRLYMIDGEDQSISTDSIPLDTQVHREVKKVADDVRRLVDTVNPTISTDIKEEVVKKISQDASNPAGSNLPAATKKSFTIGRGKYVVGAVVLAIVGLLAYKYRSTPSQDENEDTKSDGATDAKGLGTNLNTQTGEVFPLTVA